LDKYIIKVLPRAHRDLDGFYEYIAQKLMEPDIAVKLTDALERAIFGLESMPQRGALRKIGVYANKGYRQVFVGNFAILYRIKESTKQVLIVTVRYAKSQF
jgi:plasmid stabilization system protein ParE